MGTVNPLHLQATRNIVANQGLELVDVAYDPQQGITQLEALADYAAEDFAALVIQQPNFMGCLETVDVLTDWAHANGLLVIASVNPTSLALLKPPGEWGEQGADIAVGEGQPLGIPLSSGGPYCGFIACQQKYVRQMPGRIIGRTVDLEGRPGFTLTLQAREQHIRRSKATSNICTNQGLAMTAATIYLSLLGADGLRAVAVNSHNNSRRLLSLLTAIDGVEPVFTAPYFHEVVIRLPRAAAEVLNALADQGIQGGLDLSPYYPELENCVLVCATETKTDADLERYAQALKAVL